MSYSGEMTLFQIEYNDILSKFQVWDDEAHADLIKTLKAAFTTWWVKPLEDEWNASLNEVWTRTGLPENQGRIILTYSVSIFKNCQKEANQAVEETLGIFGIAYYSQIILTYAKICNYLKHRN